MINPLRALCETVWRWWCRMPEPGPSPDALEIALADKRRYAKARDAMRGKNWAEKIQIAKDAREAGAIMRHGSGDPGVRFNMLTGTATEIHKEKKGEE